MVKRPKSNDVEFDPVTALQSLTLVVPSTTRPFSEPILHNPSCQSCATSTSPNISVRGQDPSTLGRNQIVDHSRRTHCPALQQSRPNRPRVLRKVPTKDCEQDNTRKTASFNPRDSESGTPSAADANAKGDPTISLVSASPSQSRYPTQRDSIADGKGSGCPEKLSHLRAMTESGLGKNKVAGVLPESATKVSAHGGLFAKDGTKAEGFDGDNEGHYVNGWT
jgi:hypothetical protein